MNLSATTVWILNLKLFTVLPNYLHIFDLMKYYLIDLVFSYIYSMFLKIDLNTEIYTRVNIFKVSIFNKVSHLRKNNCLIL